MASDLPPTGVPGPERTLADEPTDPQAPPSGGLRAASADGTPASLRHPVARAQPRSPMDEALAPKDVPGIRTALQLGCVSGPQLREEVYGRCRESNFARRLKRWKARGWAGSSRFLGMGVNLIWGTAKGAAVLEEGGHARPDELFPRTRPVAPKDLVHHGVICDLWFLARRGVPRRYETAEPAWLLQRREPDLPAIPDLLLSSPGRHSGQRHLLAFEVDLASENLTVFLKKLPKLGQVLVSKAAGGSAAVIALVRGAGRAVSLERQLAALAEPMPVPVAVRLLPASGSYSREALAAVISRSGKSPDGGLTSAPGASR